MISLLLLASFLTARTETLGPEYLASTSVNTPDCNQTCFLGQQIVVHWKIPPACCAGGDLFLRLFIRYGDHTLDTVTEPCVKRRGFFVYRLLNQDYWDRAGFLAYKVELWQGDQLIDCWQHHLWADIINVSPNQ